MSLASIYRSPPANVICQRAMVCSLKTSYQLLQSFSISVNRGFGVRMSGTITCLWHLYLHILWGHRTVSSLIHFAPRLDYQCLEATPDILWFKVLDYLNFNQNYNDDIIVQFPDSTMYHDYEQPFPSSLPVFVNDKVSFHTHTPILTHFQLQEVDVLFNRNIFFKKNSVEQKQKLKSPRDLISNKL